MSQPLTLTACREFLVGTNHAPFLNIGDVGNVISLLSIEILRLLTSDADKPVAMDNITQVVSMSFVIVCFSPDVVHRKLRI